MVGSGISSQMRRARVMVAVVAALVLSTATVVGAAGSLWNISSIGAPLTDGGVVIAVVDTGVDSTHPAFGSRVLPQIDIVGGSNRDPNGHGTHVAGTAAGGAVNCGELSGGSSKSIGVAPGAQILPVRVLDEDGAGFISDVAEGIRAAADRGAHVINLSLGTDLNGLTGASGELLDAIEYAWAKGSIPVLAAGNHGLVGGLFGSGYGDISAIVVTAVDRQGSIARYATDVGSAKWGIAAPGGSGSGRVADDVVSSYKDETCGLLAGTSMAAPHVSGALAILRARGLSPQQAVNRLLSTARPKSPARTYGAGLLDLGAAASGIAVSPTTATTAPPPTAAPATSQPPPTATAQRSGPLSTAPGSTARPGGTSSTTPPADPTTTTAEPGTTTVGTAPPTTAEVAAGELEVTEEESGSVSLPVAATAGLAVAALWLVLGRNAARLRG